MHSALTIRAKGLLKVLQSKVKIYPSGQKGNTEIIGVWDTGATNTAITKKVVDNLELIPSGKTLVNTAAGTTIQNTYTIDIKLPNGVLITGITANEAVLGTECDSLIGMDVINMGDFAISNHKGETCMSFRTPSGHEIDYVKNLTYGMTPIKNPPKIKNKYTNKRR